MSLSTGLKIVVTGTARSRRNALTSLCSKSPSTVELGFLLALSLARTSSKVRGHHFGVEGPWGGNLGEEGGHLISGLQLGLAREEVPD